jgi:hypothetical protein
MLAFFEQIGFLLLLFFSLYDMYLETPMELAAQ